MADKAMKEAMKQYRLWVKSNEELAKKGLHGTDYYVNRVEMLEAKVKKLQAKLKKKGNK